MQRRQFLSATAALGAGAASAEDVKIGLSLGYTGPLESMAPAMTQGAELAIKEVNDSGKFMGGSNVTSVQVDNTCTDAAASVAAPT